jgi:hypothetical protein
MNIFLEEKDKVKRRNFVVSYGEKYNFGSKLIMTGAPFLHRNIRLRRIDFAIRLVNEFHKFQKEDSDDNI